MNYGGNMPDWHQYNSPQSIGSEVSSIGQNVNHSPIFGPSISPRRLNGSTYSPETLNKPQNDVSFNPRNFQRSPNTLNASSDNSAMGSTVQISGCHGHYGTPNSRNTLGENTNATLDPRNARSDSLTETIGQQNHQISMNGPTGHLNCPTINGSMGLMGQRNIPTGLQGPISNIRQGPGSYMTCKGPCCNADSNLSYQTWEKFGPYPPNLSYRDTGYPVDNRRFANEFETRESLANGTYNIDPRRNFPDYKYRKDSVIPRGYAHSSGVIQNYPVQNYNFPVDYQKYPGYPVKEYPPLRADNPITNSQNPAVLKYQEQSVIVQQKYFSKQIQYQNGGVPKSVVSTNMGANIISRAQNPYFNPQLPRNVHRDYSDSTSLANRGTQPTNSIHLSYPKYQMYQQKIAMQRFSMENHLRELTRLPGYQSHPKYQECVLRYRELLSLQQTVDYSSTVQDPPRVINSCVNEEIPPINLQFDQNGVLINSNFAFTGFTNPKNPIDVQNSKSSQGEDNPDIRTQNIQQPNQFKAQVSFDNHTQNQDSSLLLQIEPSSEKQEHYSMEKEFDQNQYQGQKCQNESINVGNSDDDQISSVDHRSSKAFADKPELDVRQFLANWDESEEEDEISTNLSDAALDSSTSVVVVEYDNTKTISNNLEESENCSEVQDCQGKHHREIFENAENKTKSSHSADDQIHEYVLPPDTESIKSSEHGLNISDSEMNATRSGTVIQSIGTDCKNETTGQIIDNLADCQNTHGIVKLVCQETESDINASQETLDAVKTDTTIKKESSIEEVTITSIKNHIEVYKYENTAEICSNVEETIKNNDNSKSNDVNESSRDMKHFRDSNEEDLSESGDSKSTDNRSISSFIKSPKTIRGTEIHADAQELSVIPALPKSNSELLNSPNLQKQNSFVSEESHNPDDISLPDLPTSECTPISTTLNTPVHSDSEESSEPVIDLTIPTNPIEIIQNSPMLSFTHSPIKMEPYEHLDENDLTDQTSHDALEFKFQSNNNCDNDFEKSIEVSNEKLERYNVPQSNENTVDSDCVLVLSEKGVKKLEGNASEVELKNIVACDMKDNESIDENQFSFNKVKDKVSNMIRENDRAWLSVDVKDHKPHISEIPELQNNESPVDKFESLSEMKSRLKTTSEVNESYTEDDMAHISNVKNGHGMNRWQIERMENEMNNVESESTDGLTALNLVKDKNEIKSDSLKITDEATDSQFFQKDDARCSSHSNETINFQHSNPNESMDSSMERQEIFTHIEHTTLYSSSAEEEKMYRKDTKNQSNFPNSLNIPLIPGEDFEEPKMPVLPMEGNCLTTIIKNTSPITDLDVLGSDDEKLDKMDDIWVEVGNVEIVNKTTYLNIDGYPECGENADRGRNTCSRSELCKLQKNERKRAKNSVRAKDFSKLFGKVWDDSEKINSKSNTRENVQSNSLFSSDMVAKEVEPINKDIRSAIFSDKVPVTPKIMSNNSIHEDGNPSYNICSGNNTTVIIKCQEKANHINDIATKLLENAKLFVPELRKIEIQKMESSKSGRDSSKKSIKLLKEFRKVRNKKDDTERGMALPVKIKEECEKLCIKTMEIDDKTLKSRYIGPDIIKDDSQKPDSLVEKVDANGESDNPHLTSTDIVITEEKYTNMLNDTKNILENDALQENNFNINIANSITIKDSGSVDSHKILNKKDVNIFEKNIIKCAINSSKPSNGLDSLQVSHENGCATDNSNNLLYTSENINLEKTLEIPNEIKQKTNFEEIDDRCSLFTDHCSLSKTVCAEDDSLSIQRIKKTDKILETTNDKNHTVTECNSECDSTLIRTERIFKKVAEHEGDHQFVLNINDEESNKLPDNLEETKEQSEFNEKYQTNADEIVNAEASGSSENIQVDRSNTSLLNGEKSIESACRYDDDGKKKLHLNHTPPENISVKSYDNLLQNTNNSFEKKTINSPKTSTESALLCTKSNSTENLSIAEEITDSEPMTVDECAVNFSKTPHNLVTPNIDKKLGKNCEDPEDDVKSLSLSESWSKTPLENFTKPKCTQSSDSNHINSSSETNKNLRTFDNSLETFGLDNSFNYDFNNFDVAPNISNVTDCEQSNSWKYSKACARFEDCERYKNPDNFIDPILTSLESLDSLNTVPIYTTKDGKITYSPNPKFTYKALIIEAREREGYPTMREPYYGTPRNQESALYSKNRNYFRKRKSSEGYSYSRSYGKRNYLERYEPREHGESSVKSLYEPWNKSYFNHNKYRHRARDRNSYNFTCHEIDPEKKFTTEKIVQQKITGKQNYGEGYIVFDEHDKTKNGTLNNNSKCNGSKQYNQFKEQVFDSAWSRNNQKFKYDQNSPELTRSKLDTNMSCDKKKKNLENTINTVECFNVLKKDDQSKDFLQTKIFNSLSNKIKYTDGCSTKIYPTKPEPSTFDDTRHMAGKVFDLDVEELKLTLPKPVNTLSNDPNLLKISKAEVDEDRNVTFESCSLEGEDSSEHLVAQQEKSFQVNILNDSLLDTVTDVCNKKIEFPKLYDDIDDICESKMSNVSKCKLNNTDLLIAESSIIPSSLIKFPIMSKNLEQLDYKQVELNIEVNESSINKTVDEDDIAPLIPVQLTLSEINSNELKIPKIKEISEKNEFIANLDLKKENIPEDEPNESTNSSCTSVVKNINHRDSSKEGTCIDEHAEMKNFQINNIQLDVEVSKLNDEVLHSSENLCSLQNLQDVPKIKEKEEETKSNGYEVENKNRISKKNEWIKSNENISLETTVIHENIPEHQSHCTNYIAYSPSSECSENAKAIPKLVIKKMDSFNCKNVGLSQPSTPTSDSFAEKATDKDNRSSKGSLHPKIPKILIRNIKSRPGTPSIDEIVEKKVFSVTTKNDNKVKIRFEEKRPESPAVSSYENISKTDDTESKIPKMKIKLEDKLPKIFIENMSTKAHESNADHQKIVPKMKIKKLKGTLSQIVDTQILPVSIPRMLICKELESKQQTSQQVIAEKEIPISDMNPKTGASNLISNDQKAMKDIDIKKIPILKIKRQSSGCSIELNKKRHNVSPIQSELKKIKRSLKLAELDDKKQSNQLFMPFKHQENSRKIDTFSIQQSYELANPIEPEYTTAVPRNDSKRENVSGTPDEIPKVIIKRASPSAEFKCELSKGRRDAIIKNKKWQPEVKLQRSWVLDCMAKDLNLGKLTLKLAPPNSLLKKCSMQKKEELKEICTKNNSIKMNQSYKKLFRSKSTSDLISTCNDTGTYYNYDTKPLIEPNINDLPKELITRKRCKSELGNTFTENSKNFEFKKKFKCNNQSNAAQMRSKCTRDHPQNLINSSDIQSAKGTDTVIESYQKLKYLHMDFEKLNTSKSNDAITNYMPTIKRISNKTLDENMNSQSEISILNISHCNNSVLNCAAVDRSGEVDLNSRILSGSSNKTNSTKSTCECFENSSEFPDVLTYNSKTNDNQETSNSFDNQAQSIVCEDNVPDNSAISQVVISMQPTVNISNKNSEICCSEKSTELSNTSKTMDILESIDYENKISECDINDSSDNEKEIYSIYNSNVLNTSILNNNNSINSDLENIPNSKIDVNLNNILGDAINSADNSVIRVESYEKSQTILEILSASPNPMQSEMEVVSHPDTTRDDDMCLYHEDAIPTQFELELEITDNIASDPLEVPMPQNSYRIEKVKNYSSNELNVSNHKSNDILNYYGDNVNLDDSKSETTLPEKDGTNSFHVSSITYPKEFAEHPNKQNAILSVDIDKQNTNSIPHIKSAAEFDANITKSVCYSDLLVKEVLAAKETLRKCLSKNKNESRFKLKTRPKTAAEKKQGSGFDLDTLSISKDSFVKLSISHDRSKPWSQNSNNDGGSEKPFQNQTKPEFKVNTLKLESKHSKSIKNNFKQKKCSSLPTNTQKYTNVTQPNEYLIPQHSSTDVEDNIEFVKDERTISLRHSKHLIKNTSYSDTQKNIPDLVNSKDNKYKSKSSRQDNDQKLGKLKNALSNVVVQESSVDSDQCKGKSASEFIKHKYKSSKTSSDQNMKSMNDKTKFKSYKIPKLIKSTRIETERLSEVLEESQSKEAGMPILEPQVDLNQSLEVSELSFGRDVSRSPPVITNEEVESSYEMTTRNLQNDQFHIDSDKEKEISPRQRTMSAHKEVPESMPAHSKELTVADIVKDMAYHEKATIRHRRYCTLCERWFPTVARHRRHLSGYQHRHMELTQRRTIHALFTLFTGRPCPRLQPPRAVRIDCEPGELTPLQIAVEGVTKESSKVDGNIKTPTSDDK